MEWSGVLTVRFGRERGWVLEEELLFFVHTCELFSSGPPVIAMYVMKDEVGAIALMVVSLWCLGSWPALFNVLEQRGRVPMHTYLDYTIANFAVALLFAFTLGEIGPGTNEFPNFITQLFQV